MAEATGYDISGAITTVETLYKKMAPYVATYGARERKGGGSNFRRIMEIVRGHLDAVSAKAPPDIGEQRKNYIRLIVYYGLLIYVAYELADYNTDTVKYIADMPGLLLTFFYTIGGYAYEAIGITAEAGSDIVDMISRSFFNLPSMLAPFIKNSFNFFTCVANTVCEIGSLTNNLMVTLLSAFVVGTTFDYATGTDIVNVSLNPLITKLGSGIEATAQNVRDTIGEAAKAGHKEGEERYKMLWDGIAEYFNKLADAATGGVARLGKILNATIVFVGETVNLTIYVSDMALFGPYSTATGILETIPQLQLRVVRKSERVRLPVNRLTYSVPGGGGAPPGGGGAPNPKRRRIEAPSGAGAADGMFGDDYVPYVTPRGGRRRRTRRGPKKHKRKTRRANKKQKTRKHKRKQTRRRRRRSSKK